MRRPKRMTLSDCRANLSHPNPSVRLEAAESMIGRSQAEQAKQQKSEMDRLDAAIQAVKERSHE